MAESWPLPEHSTIVAAPDVVVGDLGDEVVMLNTQNGTYYGVEGVGATVWNLIQSPMTVAQVRDALLDVYEVHPDICVRDLMALLKDLAAHGLIKIEL
jgi:hypothetical protein